MKRMMIIAIIVFSMVLGSCDLAGKYDITVENNCSFKIEVGINQSATTLPSPRVELLQSKTVKYTDLSYGTHYLHMIDPGQGTPNQANNRSWTSDGDTVSRNETWRVSWTGTAYKVDRIR